MEAMARASHNLKDSADDEAPTDTLALGVAMGLTASILINLSQNILAPPPVQNGNTSTSPSITDPNANTVLGALDTHIVDRVRQVGKGSLSRRFWSVVWLSSITLNFAAFSFGPAGVLASLEGAQFVASFVYFFFWVKDTEYRNATTGGPTANGWRKLIGTVIVCAGIVLPALASNSGGAVFDMESLACMWTRPRWIVFYSVWQSVALAVLCFYIFVRRGSLLTLPQNGKTSQDRLNLVLFAFVAGSVGQTAIVNAKAISELLALVRKGEGGELFENGSRWALTATTTVLVLLGFAVWVILLGKGPGIYDPPPAITTLQSAYIVIGSLGSTIFFEEIDAMDDIGKVQYFLGMSCVVVGAIVMLPSPDAVEKTDGTTAMSSLSATAEPTQTSIKKMFAGSCSTRPRLPPEWTRKTIPSVVELAPLITSDQQYEAYR